MKRYLGQLMYVSDHEEIKHTVIELDNQSCVSCLIPLSFVSVEPEATIFIDGVITPCPVSIHEKTASLLKKPDLSGYNYIVVSNDSSLPDNLPSGLPLILDFGSSDVRLISKYLAKCAGWNLSLSEFFNACIFNPAKVLNINADIRTGVKVNLIHWQNVDVVSKKLTTFTKLVELA
ncbi:MAG: hypothetical protein H6Q18_78 [Bacteroidetes bacterium]|nr:hypothetical protein [Bacteroidota bacterium]